MRDPKKLIPEGQGREKWIMETRKAVYDIDSSVGGFVSSVMCSHLCPCDFDDIPLEAEKEWLTLFANEANLTPFERCNIGPGCDVEKEIILFKGVDTLNTILAEMEEFKIQQYTTFQFCFEDMKNGRRDEKQVSEEMAKEMKDLYDSDQM